MKTYLLRGVLLLGALALTGCPRGEPLPPGTVPEDTDTRLGDTLDFNVNTWLTLPRKDLARLCDEWNETIKAQLTAIRNDSESAELLPRLYSARSIPVFQDAAFSDARGFSVPPYVKAGKPDSGVALHLARHGDYEAALKIADPADTGMRAMLDSLKLDKNVPVEWARLVGLVQYSAHLRVMCGEVAGMTQLVLVHQQLGQALSGKASEGPLGMALLPAGKRALTLAASALREPKRNKTALAGDIEHAITEWGKVPEISPLLQPGDPAEKAMLVFGPFKGQAVIATQKEEVARTLDLLALPVPGEGVQNTAVFLNNDGAIAEVQFAYRPKLETLYPDPTYLAQQLEPLGFVGKAETKTAALQRHLYTLGDAKFEVVRTSRGESLGALVRFTREKVPAKTEATRNLRDYGPFHLDRGFEAMRLVIAPKQSGNMLVVQEGKSLEAAGKALNLPAPSEVVLQRRKDHNLLESMRVAWPGERTVDALQSLLPVLWSAYGDGKVEGVEDQVGSYLAFGWGDDKTRIQLRLPFQAGGPVLVVEDLRKGEQLVSAVDSIAKRDSADRVQRVQTGKAIELLPRSAGVINSYNLDDLKLGMPRSEALALLPKGKGNVRGDLPNGVMVVLQGEVPREAPVWARQLVLQFGPDQRVSEIRVRYLNSQLPIKKGETLEDRLSRALVGAVVQPALWSRVWIDQPVRGKYREVRWQDDTTVQIYRRDDWGSEVVLQDRPKDGEAKTVGFVSRGLPGCSIGDTKETVRQALKEPATTMDRTDVHRMPMSSPYEMALVWYDGNKVSKVQVVHRERPTEGKELDAVQMVWAKNLSKFGFPRRQEKAREALTGAILGHDDEVRIQVFAQVTDQGGRLFTEWQSLPIKLEKRKK